MTTTQTAAAPADSRVVSTPERGRIRVCLVGPSLDILGGQAVQLANLLERLRRVDGLEMSFCAVNPRLPGPLGVLRRVKYVRTVLTSVAYAVSLFRMLRGVDVVHAFSASYWSFLLAPLPAMVVARLYRKAVVLNYHSGEADDHLRRWKRTALPAMRLAHEIVVPSAYLVEVFANHGLGARAVANFVDTDRLPYRRRGRLRPVFLSNRNLEPMYNVACTLNAFARIQREVPESCLIVAGFGSEQGRLEALAAELGLRHVVFRGRTAPAEMERLYDEADVYLNSSDIDNMPLSLLEAFAAGLPVVTTDAGGIPFVAAHERNALVVSRGDSEALAAGALRLLREEGLGDRLAEAARADCLTSYTWPPVRAAWERVYRDVDARVRRVVSA